MFAVKKLFLIAVLAVLVVPNAMANIPSTAYVQEIVKSLELKPATETELGGVKVGENINVDENGRISVATGSPEALGVVKVGQIPSGSEDSTTYATIWVE